MQLRKSKIAQAAGVRPPDPPWLAEFNAAQGALRCAWAHFNEATIPQEVEVAIYECNAAAFRLFTAIDVAYARGGRPALEADVNLAYRTLQARGGVQTPFGPITRARELMAREYAEACEMRQPPAAPRPPIQLRRR